MAAPSTHEITRLLRAWSAGDQAALENLAPLIYEELHRAAHHYMAGEQPGHTLQTTALVPRRVEDVDPSVGPGRRGTMGRTLVFFICHATT